MYLLIHAECFQQNKVLLFARTRRGDAGVPTNEVHRIKSPDDVRGLPKHITEKLSAHVKNNLSGSAKIFVTVIEDDYWLRKMATKLGLSRSDFDDPAIPLSVIGEQVRRAIDVHYRKL